MAARPVVLTAAAVARLKPDAKRREVPDGGVRGLSLLIHPSGAKSWVMRYRRPGNMTAMTKLTLGSADLSGAEGEGEPVIGGHLTLAAARRLAAEVQRQRALGRDPAANLHAEKQARQQATMFGERLGTTSRSTHAQRRDGGKRRRGCSGFGPPTLG